MSALRHRRADLAGQEDRRYAITWGVRLPPRFADLVVPGAPRRGRQAAEEVVERIHQALDRGGLSKSERSQLYRAKRVWVQRASGRDPWYTVVGNRGGVSRDERARIDHVRVTVAVEAILDACRRRHEEA